MYCYKCGKQLQDDDNFCPYCGAKVKHDDAYDGEINENASRDYISDNDIFFGDKIKSEDRNNANRANAQSQHFQQANIKEANGIGIAGFICSFLVPILGLILSIIAYEKLKKMGASTKMATWGIIIAIASLVLSVISNILTITVLPSLTGRL